MIKSLQRRFVLTAMLSLFVLLMILIGGIITASYVAMERNTDQALEMLSSDIRPPAPNENERRPFFGYQINPSPTPFMNRSIVMVDAQREIVSVDAGFDSSYDEAEIHSYALDILETEKTKGKISSFKYVVTSLSDGGQRIVFLDVSVQTRMLADTASVACLIGLACMVLMLIISIVVSGPVMKPIAGNIEKQRQFVSNAGHEIKTPLGIIMANTDAMELHLGENKWSKNIRNQTERMHGLMNLLLLLARMDEGAEAIPMEPVNLSNIVNKVNRDLLELAKNKQIQIQTTVAENIITQGNPDHLEQLISILLDNAVKYADTGGEIIVLLTTEGRKSKLVVENSIETIPDVPPDTLFDRFYRANTARTQKDGGYGIGLSAARAIAGMHGGKIEAFYIGEHRIRFAVDLP